MSSEGKQNIQESENVLKHSTALLSHFPFTSKPLYNPQQKTKNSPRRTRTAILRERAHTHMPAYARTRVFSSVPAGLYESRPAKIRLIGDGRGWQASNIFLLAEMRERI